MVPRLDNDAINTRSRSDYSSISPAQALIEILREHENIIHDIRRNQIDIDMWGTDSGATGIVTLTDQVRTPFMITDVIATWNAPLAQPASSLTNDGSVTSPGAGGIIAQLLNVPKGIYNAYVYFNIAGTVAQGTDNNNIFLFVSGGTPNTSTLDNEIVAGPQPFGPILISTPGGAAVQVKANVAGTVGSIYAATLVLSPVVSQGAGAGTATLILGDRTIPLPYNAGSFIMDSLHGIQTDIRKPYSLTITPPSQCYLEILGYSDYRKIDTP